MVVEILDVEAPVDVQAQATQDSEMVPPEEIKTRY